MHEARIAAAEGRLDADIPYLEEEVQYAGNAIYRKEMQLTLAEYALRTGDQEKARAYLHDIIADRKEAYTKYTKAILDAQGEKIGEEDSDGFVVIRE